ncbi:hypothetical protein D3C71_1006580 [compost metagenome]
MTALHEDPKAPPVLWVQPLSAVWSSWPLELWQRTSVRSQLKQPGGDSDATDCVLHF